MQLTAGAWPEVSRTRSSGLVFRTSPPSSKRLTPPGITISVNNRSMCFPVCVASLPSTAGMIAQRLQAHDGIAPLGAISCGAGAAVSFAFVASAGKWIRTAVPNRGSL